MLKKSQNIKKSQKFPFLNFFSEFFLPKKKVKIAILLVFQYENLKKSLFFRKKNLKKKVLVKKKSSIWETKHLSMRIVSPMPLEGGPRIPQNPIFLTSGKNHSKRKNSKTSRNKPKLAIYPLTRGL